MFVVALKRYGVTVLLVLCCSGMTALLVTRHGSQKLSFAAHVRVPIGVSEVSAVPHSLPAVLPLNTCETQKDLDNWIARHHARSRKTRSQEYVTQGCSSMRVELSGRRWTELVLIFFPQEWEHYQWLALDIANPDDVVLSWEVRIGDYFDSANFHPETSAFARSGNLRRGLERVRFPMREIAQKIDISSRRKIIHFRVFAEHAVFFIDNARLEQ